MTGRECLQAILRRETPPRLCWTTLVDDLTRSVMPAEARALSPFDFYRHIGCDILQFGNYGLPTGVQVPPPARSVQPPHDAEHRTEPDGTQVTTTHTEWGDLVSRYRSGHPTKHPVETLADLRVARRMWEGTTFERAACSGEDEYARIETAIGDDGLYLPTLDPSPVQQLLELDMGLIGFYGLLQDHPREMADLLEAMQQARRQEWEIVAGCSPAAALIAVENTSSTMISPDIYRRYSLPQLREIVDICHAHGKLAIFHMCGLLWHLLPVIRETGLDGINALTPPPHGDTTIEQALDVCGEDLIILGGIFDGSVFQAPEVTRAQLHRALEELYTPRVRRAKLLLWFGADGLPTPLERFLAVKEWFEERR